MAYLTPEVPRWLPRNEADILASARDGLLVENHYFELKAMIATGSSHNKRTGA